MPREPPGHSCRSGQLYCRNIYMLGCLHYRRCCHPGYLRFRAFERRCILLGQHFRHPWQILPGLGMAIPCHKPLRLSFGVSLDPLDFYQFRLTSLRCLLALLQMQSDFLIQWLSKVPLVLVSSLGMAKKFSDLDVLSSGHLIVPA